MFLRCVMCVGSGYSIKKASQPRLYEHIRTPSVKNLNANKQYVFSQTTPYKILLTTYHKHLPGGEISDFGFMYIP